MKTLDQINAELNEERMARAGADLPKCGDHRTSNKTRPKPSRGPIRLWCNGGHRLRWWANMPRPERCPRCGKSVPGGK